MFPALPDLLPVPVVCVDISNLKIISIMVSIINCQIGPAFSAHFLDADSPDMVCFTKVREMIRTA